MAVLIQPAGSIEASGKFSGQVYTRGRVGHQMRAYRIGVQPRRQKTTENRARIQRINNHWLTLSTKEREKWDTFAATWTTPGRLGNAKRDTGLNWFTKFNARLLMLGETAITTPPLNPNPNWFPQITLFFDPVLDGIFATVDLPPSGRQAIWMHWSGRLPAGSQTPNRSIRLKKIISSSVPGPVKLISGAEIGTEPCTIQFAWYATDEFGRATTTHRSSIMNVSSNIGQGAVYAWFPILDMGEGPILNQDNIGQAVQLVTDMYISLGFLGGQVLGRLDQVQGAYGRVQISGVMLLPRNDGMSTPGPGQQIVLDGSGLVYRAPALASIPAGGVPGRGTTITIDQIEPPSVVILLD